MPLFGGPPDVAKLQAKKDVPGLIKVLGYQKDPAMRQAAAQALGAIGDPRALEALIAALRDQDPKLRATAAKALGVIGDPRAVEPLIAALADESWPVYTTSVDALGALGDPRAAGPLIAAVGRHRGMVRVEETSAALVRIGAPTPLLLTALADEDVFVRRVAARALGPLGGADAVEPLIAALADTSSWTLNSEIAAALGQISDARAIPALLAALADKHTAVSEAAAQALDRLGWQPDASSAGAGYWVSKSRWDRCLELGDLAVEPLVAFLEDMRMRPEAIRVAAVETLGSIGGERAVEALIVALKDTYTGVRRAAATALGSIGDERAVEPLVAAVKDTNLEVRWAASGALGDIGGPRALEALIPHLGRHYAGVSSDSAILKIGAPAVEALIAVLGDPERDAATRFGAANVLGELGDPRAVEPLLAALRDLAAFFPMSIISALGRLRDPRAVEPLIAVLAWRAQESRRAAARALGDLGDPLALAPLRAAEEDEDKYVRQAAAEALARISEELAKEARGSPED